ncbi:MAG: ATP-binding protein, partial [Pseudomonadota bacterium]
ALGIHALDGATVARQPLRAEDLSPGATRDAPLFAGHLDRAPVGTFREPARSGGVPRVVSYRLVEPRRLVVWVAAAAEEDVVLWRQRAVRVAVLVAAGLVVMASLTVLLVRELTRQRKAAQALEVLNQDLERSNADLEQFAYIASHDLKEPLRNIASYVQLLQRRYEGKLDPDADAFIGYTVDGVRRMQAIINELLAYSRVGTGKLVLAQIQAGAAVSTALAQLKTVIAEAQAAVEVKGPLPVVSADPPQLASLFQNLIGNGVKYRRPDVRPEVTIGAVDQGPEWAFYVADNGIGIEPQYHDQIFDLFKRLHARDRYGGTGIGLATCKRVVGRHGGRIWVESVPGQGSTFWFTLPKVPG